MPLDRDVPTGRRLGRARAANRPLPGELEEPRPLAWDVEALRRRWGISRSDELDLLAGSWESYVGTAVASRCRIEGFRDGVLRVATGDPAVADRLRWDRERLIGLLEGDLERHRPSDTTTRGIVDIVVRVRR